MILVALVSKRHTNAHFAAGRYECHSYLRWN